MQSWVDHSEDEEEDSKGGSKLETDSTGKAMDVKKPKIKPKKGNESDSTPKNDFTKQKNVKAKERGRFASKDLLVGRRWRSQGWG